MACPFLYKLAPELRNKIYGYVLGSDLPLERTLKSFVKPKEHFLNSRVSLKHATDLQPFVKKLTGVDGEVPVKYFTQHWKQVKHERCRWRLRDVDILCTSKVVYSEAVKVLYDQNIIRVDIELFDLPNILAATNSSDLSLAKNLEVALNNSSATPDMNVLLPKLHAVFPGLQSTILLTDAAALPEKSLFEICQACHTFSDID